MITEAQARAVTDAAIPLPRDPEDGAAAAIELAEALVTVKVFTVGGQPVIRIDLDTAGVDPSSVLAASHGVVQFEFWATGTPVFSGETDIKAS